MVGSVVFDASADLPSSELYFREVSALQRQGDSSLGFNWEAEHHSRPRYLRICQSMSCHEREPEVYLHTQRWGALVEQYGAPHFKALIALGSRALETLRPFTPRTRLHPSPNSIRTRDTRGTCVMKIRRSCEVWKGRRARHEADNSTGKWLAARLETLPWSSFVRTMLEEDELFFAAFPLAKQAAIDAWISHMLHGQYAMPATPLVEASPTSFAHESHPPPTSPNCVIEGIPHHHSHPTEASPPLPSVRLDYDFYTADAQPNNPGAVAQGQSSNARIITRITQFTFESAAQGSSTAPSSTPLSAARPGLAASPSATQTSSCTPSGIHTKPASTPPHRSTRITIPRSRALRRTSKLTTIIYMVVRRLASPRHKGLVPVMGKPTDVSCSSLSKRNAARSQRRPTMRSHEWHPSHAPCTHARIHAVYMYLTMHKARQLPPSVRQRGSPLSPLNPKVATYFSSPLLTSEDHLSTGNPPLIVLDDALAPIRPQILLPLTRKEPFEKGAWNVFPLQNGEQRPPFELSPATDPVSPPLPLSFQEATALARKRNRKNHSSNPRDENDDEDQVDEQDQTIDDPESRPKVPLPARRMPDPFIFPNAFDASVPPSNLDENPSIQSSQRGPERHIPAVSSTTFTRAVFPRVVLSYSQLTANLDSHIVEQVDAAPDSFIAIVPFGAGNSFYREHPKVNSEVLTFVKSLGIGENLAKLSIAKATPRNKPNARRDFEKPWTMILSGASDELRDYLLWHQTFAIHPELTFHALPFDKDLQSWIIMNISGDAVEDSAEAKTKALGAIKHKLWFTSGFRSLADRLLAALKVPASTAERAYLATTSFDLSYIESNDAQGHKAPIWQLTGKPLTTDPDLHCQFLEVIRRQTYYVGLHILECEKRLVECVWCKSNTHPAHACPFPKTEDWMGLKPDNAERFRKRVEASKKDSPAPNCRGPPGGKGSRTPKEGKHGRGGGKGGWTYVSHRK
ncbi:hypothetical protein D9615_007751 [Tricholomella constricta]|uniref:Uncharacterized protein n=1 Tax=Tricholomella constricta TaxID=117010 RepID=A0A8H5H3K3_9AGAR|nr:hypothetical protein D9615_007751 [Tricholomella constricta]